MFDMDQINELYYLYFSKDRIDKSKFQIEIIKRNEFLKSSINNNIIKIKKFEEELKEKFGELEGKSEIIIRQSSQIRPFFKCKAKND